MANELLLMPSGRVFFSPIEGLRLEVLGPSGQLIRFAKKELYYGQSASKALHYFAYKLFFSSIE